MDAPRLYLATTFYDDGLSSDATHPQVAPNYASHTLSFEVPRPTLNGFFPRKNPRAP